MNIKNALIQSGLNLKKIRLAKEWSVKTLSDVSKVPEAVIVALENGENIHIKDLYLLAEALEVSYQQIMVNAIP